ncbi:hypothetical protein [Nitrosomonas sp. Nm51]|nr:hypothetical protein [Nitrosomonas sp. Nm51]
MTSAASSVTTLRHFLKTIGVYIQVTVAAIMQTAYHELLAL